MGKKSAKHRKIKVTEQWAGMLIDMNLGGQLIAILPKDTEGGKEMIKRMISHIMEAGKLEKYKTNPQQFINDMGPAIMNIYNMYCGTKLLHCLKEGIKAPEQKKTILTLDDIKNGMKPN